MQKVSGLSWVFCHAFPLRLPNGCILLEKLSDGFIFNAQPLGEAAVCRQSKVARTRSELEEMEEEEEEALKAAKPHLASLGIYIISKSQQSY